MEFTKKEYEEILKARAKQIESFISTEIQPHLTKEIKIFFGDIVKRGRYNEIRECEYDLIVNKNKFYGGIGGLTIYFDVPDYAKNITGCIDIYNDWVYGGRFIYNLCLHWQSVKYQLLQEVETQKRNNNAVFNEFEI